MGDARHPWEKMFEAMRCLVTPGKDQRALVGGAIEAVLRAGFDDPASVPSWAKDEAEALFEMVPINGAEREAWLRTATHEDLDEACQRMLSLYDTTTQELGRQTRR